MPPTIPVAAVCFGRALADRCRANFGTFVECDAMSLECDGFDFVLANKPFFLVMFAC